MEGWADSTQWVVEVDTDQLQLIQEILARVQCEHPSVRQLHCSDCRPSALDRTELLLLCGEVLRWNSGLELDLGVTGDHGFDSDARRWQNTSIRDDKENTARQIGTTAKVELTPGPGGTVMHCPVFGSQCRKAACWARALPVIRTVIRQLRRKFFIPRYVCGMQDDGFSRGMEWFRCHPLYPGRTGHTGHNSSRRKEELGV